MSSSAADTTGTPDLDPEDAKLVTLARSSRARAQAAEGAAVRDGTGRTYTAATVALPSLPLTAVQAAVAAAASSGAETLEAAVVVTGAQAPSDADLAAVRDLGGAGVPLFLLDTRGRLRSRHDG